MKRDEEDDADAAVAAIDKSFGASPMECLDRRPGDREEHLARMRTIA